MVGKAMLAGLALVAAAGEWNGSLADNFGWLLGEWEYREWLAGGPQRRILRCRASTPNRFECSGLGGPAELTFGPGGSLLYRTGSGEARRGYRAVRHTSSELVFESRYGDYPQRLAYRLNGDALTYTVSQLDGSRAIVTNLRRAGAGGAD